MERTGGGEKEAVKGRTPGEAGTLQPTGFTGKHFHHHPRNASLQSTYAGFINMMKKVVCKIHTVE